MTKFTDYGHQVRKSPSLHGRKSNPIPKFLGMAEANFVCHIGPNFQISFIYAFIGCPQSVTTHNQLLTTTFMFHKIAQNFALGTKLFCLSRQKPEIFRIFTILDVVKPNKISFIYLDKEKSFVPQKVKELQYFIAIAGAKQLELNMAVLRQLIQ